MISIERKIKLFGCTIQLIQANDESSSSFSSSTAAESASGCGGQSPQSSRFDENSKCLMIDVKEKEEEQERKSSGKEHPKDQKQELKASPPSSCGEDDPETISETSSPKSSTNGYHSETTSTTTQEDLSKKLDKILPCPRCNSADTKFCYYNNYNTNQPRHFCKNCQRYWTAGGITRNMAVGAGRRKSKSSYCCSSLYHHCSDISSASNGLVHNTDNATLLSFGSDDRSAHKVLTFSNKPIPDCVKNGIFAYGERTIEYNDDHLSKSYATASELQGNKSGALEIKSVPEFHPPQSQYNWSSMFGPPGFASRDMPIFFCTCPAYWGCTVPLISTSLMPNVKYSSSSSKTSFSSPGKHSREGNLFKAEKSGGSTDFDNSEGIILDRETSMIDDAAGSSMWSALGAITSKKACIGERVFCNGFDRSERTHITETSLALQANPAALSRSLNFRESF